MSSEPKNYDLEAAEKSIVIAREEIGEILGMPPKSIYLLANIAVIFVLILIFICSLLIPYQTTLNANVTITTLRTDSTINDDAMPGKDSIIVTATTSIANAGLIKANQIVNITLDAYPAEEYGFLLGVVKEIKPFKSSQKVELVLRLQMGFKTVKNKKIPPHPILTGIGRIVIKKSSYFNKLFIH